MMAEEIIYLDHNATTPVDPRVLDAMMPYFTEIYGNAASVDHEYGYQAKKAVDKAREQIASVINAKPDEIIFTSGATESDNITLFGVAEKYSAKGDHIITCVTEHKAILDCCDELENRGLTITRLPVDQYGRVNPEILKDAITEKTILISIMAANNEIGTIAPIKEIGKIAREQSVLFHTDAAQAVGYIPIDVEEMKIDIMSMSAHKIYGPKGIGVLYRRRSNPRANLSPRIFGGGHERGLRSGTLNVPAIVGFGEALRIAKKEMKTETTRLQELREQLFKLLKQNLEEILLNGHPTQRLAHNLNISIPGIESRALIPQLNKIAISTGSACTTAQVEPSHVIEALGFGSDRAHSALRISFGRSNDKYQAEKAAQLIIENVITLLSMVV